MKIYDLPIEDLIPYEKNPRNNKKAIDYVATSIEEFGFKVPIVVDTNKILVAGHTRLEAAKKLGLKSVPVLIADDLNDEQIKAFRLADNKTAEMAEWDFDLLEEELADICSIDMSEFGFDISEFNDNEVVEDDFQAEIPKEPKSKLGDIYQLGRHRLMCGDATNEIDISNLLNTNEIELVLTDPPYGVKAVKNKKVGGGGKLKFGQIGGSKIVEAKDYMPIKGDETTDTARANFEIIKCISKNQIIFGGNYFTDFLEPKACWVVWDKENSGNFADVEMAWTSFDKGAKLYKWLWNGLCRKGAKDVELKTRIHPTQKPVGLIAEILSDFSNENDSILDCFGGSGSTLIACEQINRQCFMVEFEPVYVDMIIERWEKFTGKKAVLLNG